MSEHNHRIINELLASDSYNSHSILQLVGNFRKWVLMDLQASTPLEAKPTALSKTEPISDKILSQTGLHPSFIFRSEHIP